MPVFTHDIYTLYTRYGRRLSRHASIRLRRRPSHKCCVGSCGPPTRGRHYSLVMKMMNQLIGERDWSTQEVVSLALRPTVAAR